ncbi:alpha/beta fold hydrolase [Nocardioides sp. NPDC004968]|uniref:alpha/beta fold hydrolase n=1 Tax=Nocardioides sp. NPDC004968 TaxID=3155894 RepID=UPI0033B8B25E
MAILPHPRQAAASIATTVSAAAGNVAHSLLYGGLADIRPMPRTLIDDGNRRELYHYRPVAGTTPEGDPVLLVTPLAAPAICYDLRRGCSVVEHLVGTNRPTYLVEYGEVNFADRSLGIEHWIAHVVPEAIRSVSEHAGGRPVHVVGWSLGGIFTMLAAADAPDLPIASLAVLGSPCDVRQVPLIAPLRPLLNLPPGNLVTTAYQAFGGAPKPLVRWAFQISSVDKMFTKPVAKLSNLADREFLAQLEAVDRFTDNIIAYPGRTFGQLYHHFFRTNALFSGQIDLSDDHSVYLRDVKQPTLVVAGANDGIGPVASVRPLVDLLTGAEELRFEIVPGGHLGLLTGRAARDNTWPLLDEWFTQHD